MTPSVFIPPFKLELKFHIYIKQVHNFACCFVWVWNLVAHIEGGT